MKLTLITRASTEPNVVRLLELRTVAIDGSEFVVTRTRDVNGNVELLAWEPWANHDRKTTVLGERLGAVAMREVPDGADFDDFWGECDAYACRVIDAAFPDARGEYVDGSFVEVSP